MCISSSGQSLNAGKSVCEDIFRSETLRLRRETYETSYAGELKNAIRIALPIAVENAISGSSYVAFTRIVAPLMGRTVFSTVLNLSTMWFVRIPLAAFLSSRYGLAGVWSAMCFQLIICGILFITVLTGVIKKTC